MKFIKYIFLFIIFVTSGYIGKFISMRYVLRVKELEELKNSLNILKAKIKFTYEPLPEIFKEIGKKANYNTSNLFYDASQNMQFEPAGIAWNNSVDRYIGYITNDDKEVIKQLSKMLR